MSFSNPKLRLAAICLLATAGLSAGCAGGQSPGDYAADLFYHGRWRQQPLPIKPQVEQITLDHRVNFEPTRAVVGMIERDAIQAFVLRSRITRQERIDIDGPRNADGQHDAVTAARLVAVRAELERSGLTAVIPVDPLGFSDVGAEQVGIYVTRVLAIAPDCSFPQPAIGQRPDYAWSCATVANLGYMIANPADLMGGHGISPADGEASAGSVQRYRSGSVKALIKESTN